MRVQKPDGNFGSIARFDGAGFGVVVVKAANFDLPFPLMLALGDSLAFNVRLAHQPEALISGALLLGPR